MSKSNVTTPKDTKDVGNIDAIRCYFGLDRAVTADELKELSNKERHELAKMVYDDIG